MTDDLKLQHSVLSQFRMIFGSMREHFRKLEQSTGLPGTELWVLSLLNESPGISVNDIAERMYVHQSTVSNLIKALLKKGLLAKEKDAQDRRVSVLWLTEAGKAIVSKATVPAEGLLPSVIKQLSGSDLERMAHALDLLIAKIPGEPEKNRHQPLGML